ncbi:OmpA/MotB family protein [Flavitalea flava]
MRLVYLYSVILSSAIGSCVSSEQFKAVQQEAKKNDSLYTQSMRTLKTCQDSNNDLARQKTTLQNQANDLNLQLTVSKDNNTQMRKQLQDLSAISSAQAESINKSLDNIGAKDQYIRDLQYAMAHRDSVNLVVVMNLKAMLGGYGDQDVSIKVDKGTVYVDLSDKLLFSSDTNIYILPEKAKPVIGRLARVLNDNPEIEFIVEGHTDSIANPTDILPDNWDISVKRATSVVRILQHEYHVSPIRMTASGRSEYVPIGPNDVPEGRAANRRTRIILLPKTDQLFKVLEHRQGQGTASTGH